MIDPASLRFSVLLGMGVVLAACGDADSASTAPGSTQDAAAQGADAGEAGAAPDATSPSLDASSSADAGAGSDAGSGDDAAADAGEADAMDGGASPIDAGTDAPPPPCPPGTTDYGACDPASDHGNCALAGYEDAGRTPYCFCTQYATDARWTCRATCPAGVEPGGLCDPMNLGTLPPGEDGCNVDLSPDGGPDHPYVCLCLAVQGKFTWFCVDTSALRDGGADAASE